MTPLEEEKKCKIKLTVSLRGISHKSQKKKENRLDKEKLILRVVRRELDRLVGELWREVGEVRLVLQPRAVRRRDLLLLQLCRTKAKAGREETQENMLRESPSTRT